MSAGETIFCPTLIYMLFVCIIVTELKEGYLHMRGLGDHCSWARRAKILKLEEPYRQEMHYGSLRLGKINFNIYISLYYIYLLKGYIYGVKC